MGKIYGIAISCIPSERLIINENGEEFFECMNEEEMIRIQKENDEDSLKTRLFNMLSMMDSTISAIATKDSPTYIKIIFVIKDGIKGSALNISNEDLSATETIVLGGVTIVVGIATILLLPEGIIALMVSIIISYVLTWLLNNTYIYLRDNAPQIWQNAKNKANDAWQYIMSLIESDSRSLNEKKQSLTQKATDEILSIIKQRQDLSTDYEKCVTLLCEYNKNTTNNVINKQKNPTKSSTTSKINQNKTTQTTPTSTNITNPLHILLYLEDAITPLNDITIKLTPNHIKDFTKPQDSIQEQISKNGKATFNIPNNANTFDLEIIDDRFYPKVKGYTQRVTNSYYKNNNTIELHLLAKIWLYFNGEKIFIMRGNKIVETFRAYSGNALNLAQKQNLIKERGYTQFVSYVNVEDSNKIMYFCLDKHWQRQKDKGSMVEGNYYVNISDIRDRWTLFTENKFGKNTRIYTDESCTNTTESTTQRSDFYLHGGDKYGNAGGIDLAKGASSFFKRLETLKEKIINNEVESKDKPIIIKLVVDYSALGIEIDCIDLTRELQTKSQNPQINTEKHKVILAANYIKPKSMPNEVFSAQKPQTYWAYKEIKKDEEFDFDNEVNMSDITHFTSEDGQKYIGESVEIDLVKYGWEDYLKQIIVFAYLQKDINRENPKLVICNPKWRIITWHNPIVNPRVTIYNSNGANKASSAFFGDTRIGNDGSAKVHKALDFFAKVGTNIYAPLDCEVANVDKKQDTDYGQCIILKITRQSLEILKIRKEAINYQLIYDYEGEMEQGDKFDEYSKQYYFFYAHLSQINENIKKGTKVLAGQVIGKSGVTGNAKGTSAPHLHFEIRNNMNVEKGKLTYLVNPAFYIEFKKLVSEFSPEEKEEQQKICRQNNANEKRCNLSVILDIED